MVACNGQGIPNFRLAREVHNRSTRRDLCELLFMDRSIGVVDDELPRAIRLLSNHLCAQSSSCQLGLGCRNAPDYPVAVQKRKTVTPCVRPSRPGLVMVASTV
jgi:hypothetical protein